MSLHITPTTKSAKVRPTTRDKLRKIIETELERQGPDADLNFIDTSLITDMSYLFSGWRIKNIKIDGWNVSNVEDMSYMFRDCNEFDCDLSSWDLSSVKNTHHMFINCSSLLDEHKPHFDIDSTVKL